MILSRRGLLLLFLLAAMVPAASAARIHVATGATPLPARGPDEIARTAGMANKGERDWFIVVAFFA